MKVTVRLHATLRRQAPEGYQNRLTVELAEGATVADLLQKLELGLEPEHLLIVINRQAALTDTVIPIEATAPKLLFGNLQYELVENGIRIKHQAPWSGSIFII